jgi:hypothetical protein
VDADLERLLAEALKLPPELRVALGHMLIDSPEDTDDEEWAAAWAREIAHRLRESEAGRTKPIPWADARRMIRGE